jgi:hypothetical protein
MHVRFIYYKETIKFPDDLKKWLSDGCNPDDFYTPKMVEDLKSLRKQRNRGVDYRRRAIWQGTNSDVRAY